MAFICICVWIDRLVSQSVSQQHKTIMCMYIPKAYPSDVHGTRGPFVRLRRVDVPCWVSVLLDPKMDMNVRVTRPTVRDWWVWKKGGGGMALLV